MATQALVLGHEPPATLHGGGIDEAVAGIAGKGGGQGGGGVGDGGRDAEGSSLGGQLLQP